MNDTNILKRCGKSRRKFEATLDDDSRWRCARVRLQNYKMNAERERERSGKKIKILWNIYTITCDMRCVPIYAPGPGARPLTNVCSVANFQQTFTFARISQTIINLDVCARECEARPSQNCVHAVAAAGAVSVHFISLGVLSPPNLRGTMASRNNISVVEHF